MFDVGFSELMMIAVVALVVIGPERLPKVARTLGHLFGRLQRYVNDVKADISREMELDELRKFKDQFEEAAHSVESSIRAEMSSAESTLNAIASEADVQTKAAVDAVESAATPASVTEATGAEASGDRATPAQEGVGEAVSRPAAAVERKTAA